VDCVSSPSHSRRQEISETTIERHCEVLVNMNIEQVLARYSAPSTYEKENGLVPRSTWKLFEGFPDVKFYVREAGNQRTTLLIVFRAGLTDNWCGWMINDVQATVMIHNFAAIYRAVNLANAGEGPLL
jgi:hypothetical protein